MKKIAVLPSLLTLGNMICGFTAITEAAQPQGDFKSAAWLILIAMIFDALDGKLARITKVTTDFGGQLDSLADMVTFGVAPAFLVVRMGIESGFPLSAAWVIGAGFATCAALRLARFNVETGPEEEQHAYFKGLPSPAAAGSIASFITLHYSLAEALGYDSADLVWMVRALPFICLALSALMISNIRYLHLLHWLFRGQWPFDYLVQIVALVFIVILTKPYSLTFLFACYVGSGLVITIHARVAEPSAAERTNPR